MTRIVLLAASLLTVVVYAQKKSMPIATGNLGVHYDINSVISTDEHPLTANVSDSLWCQAALKETPLPIVNSTFLRYGDPLKRTFFPEVNHTIHKAFLEIDPVVVHNMGKYRCQIEVMHGDKNVTVNGNLMVYSSPFFHTNRSMGMVAGEENKREVTADKLYATEGAPLEVHCPAVGFPKPNITWYKDGEVIDLDDDRISLGNDSTVITIDEFAKSDAGVYRCTATNEYPSRLEQDTNHHYASLTQEVVVETLPAWLYPLLIVALTMTLLLLLAFIICIIMCACKHADYDVEKREKELLSPSPSSSITSVFTKNDLDFSP